MRAKRVSPAIGPVSASDRRLLRCAGTAHVGVRGLPGGPDHLDPARHRRRAVARARAGAGGGRADVRDYLRRLLTSGAAYQAAEIAAKAIAVVTLPLYTRHVS